jgi:hypothetical protein
VLAMPRIPGQKQPTVIAIQKIEYGKYKLIAKLPLVLKNKTMFDKLENRLKICMTEGDELVTNWGKKEFDLTTSDYEAFKEELKVDNIPYKEIP